MTRLRRRLRKEIALLYQRWFCRSEMESLRLRRLYADIFDIEVGLFSYGCFDARRFGRGLTVGRYCSFAPTARQMNANHGIGFLSLHPYLYNVRLGLVAREPFERTRCTIGDDVWVGHNAIILPRVRSIGRGAVIGAGAVVTRDVPPYAIVAGNPAQILRYRFEPDVIAKIEASRWWLLDKTGFAALARTDPGLMFEPASHVDEGTATCSVSA